jgi:parvulin-like peptidyl-prolyl isomerase
MRLRTPLDNKTIANTLWALVALTGLVLALVGARPEPAVGVAGDTLVRVNERPITNAQLDRAAQRLAAGGARQLTGAERQSLIRLLIDEELLLQRAESLGVLQADPGVRKAIVRATIDGVVEDFLAEPPEDQQLQQFYRQHQAVFERPARVAVDALRFDDLAAARQALETAGPGDGWAGLVTSSAVRPVRQLPRSPLPAHVLRRYLGPAPTKIALSLAPGETSAPVEGVGGAYLLRVTSIIPPYLPAYQDIIAIVRQEYLSRGRELALAEKLARLWGEGDVQLNTRSLAGAEHVGILVQ